MKIYKISLVIIAVVCSLNLVSAQDSRRVKQCLQPNEAVGTPKGIFPGRVSWVHAPGVVTAPVSSGEWMSDEYVDSVKCKEMLAATLNTLAGTNKAGKAWDKIFKYFNATHGKSKKAGYRNGEKIAIKINNNNTFSHADAPEINASPQLVRALLHSLVHDAGVPEECITVAEPSRFITDDIFVPCHKEFPGVKFVDNQGGGGRIKVEFVADAMAYSKNNGPLARGIASCFTDADYVINMALLKGHVGQGVTLCGKNWYGCMSLHADWRKNHHSNFDQNRNGQPKYMTFVDFMGHKDLGGKGLIYLIDGLYGSRNVDTRPAPKWNMEPFNGDWPCTLLGSLDPVAVDMVGVDLMTTEFPDAPDMRFSDMYLLEAAGADNAPSGTVYDPEQDGTALQSLGVAEHWSDSDTRTYQTIDLRYKRL